MKSIIILQVMFVMIIVDQKVVSAKPNPYYYGRSNNFPNAYVIVFPDEFEKLTKNPVNVNPNYPMHYGPEMPTRFNDFDYVEPVANGVDVGDRTSLTLQSHCPVGTRYAYGKCRKIRH